MRFSRIYRWIAFLVIVALLVSGVAWIAADQLKLGPDGEYWQRWTATLLMVHGSAAMVALLVLGALIEAHMRRAWRARRNRATGVVMLLINACLIVSACALYYNGIEALRPWISNAHIGFGLAMPVLILVHVWIGRRSGAGQG